eukprot:TRINITY_DN2834_c0_g1_i4.p1 TRINITY_DN2834_c0_g1~~TRINITY_DN2834_c0_g1_i4.p1  ORF type:complete len:259 (+),score=52.44 TRINITY_DN2834_c0_g1_i4:45-821(+)
MIFLRFHRLSSLRTGFRAFSAESRESPNSSKGFSNPLFLLFPIPITFALGTWQVKRHFWKQELLKAVDENLHQPPTDLPQDFTANALQFRPIRIQGVYDHSQEVLVGPRAHKGKNGFHLITPMDLIDGRRVLVNRGWIPAAMKDPALRAETHTQGSQELEGLLRTGETGSYFTPPSDLSKRIFYFVDLPNIAKLSHSQEILVDSRKTPASGYPVGGLTPLQMPNNHISYVITWYSLCIAFSIMAFKRIRKPVGVPSNK